MTYQPFGILAASMGMLLPLRVLKSAAGFYIGTADDDGPVSRESIEYFCSAEVAGDALSTGQWKQRLNP